MTADCKPDPAEQGREAYGDDKTLDDNPYVMSTPEWVLCEFWLKTTWSAEMKCAVNRGSTPKCWVRPT